MTQRTSHPQDESELRVGVAAHLLGALLASIYFSILASIAVALVESEPLFQGVVVYGLFGLIAALFAGFPLGCLLSLMMRPLMNQWAHVGAFAILGFLVGAGVMGLLGGDGDSLALFGFVTALSSGLGRASMMKLAAVVEIHLIASPSAPDQV